MTHVVSEKPGAKDTAARLHRVWFRGHAHPHTEQLGSRGPWVAE